MYHIIVYHIISHHIISYRIKCKRDHVFLKHRHLYNKAPLTYNLKMASRQSKQCSGYGLLITFHVIKLRQAIQLYISLIAANTTVLPHTNKQTNRSSCHRSRSISSLKSRRSCTISAALISHLVTA
jgi:hypothetical protein